ncbi:acid phosphatase type 7 isoform X4 [Archocentrus centrarchus]|uniref:acid phosphatase type 7 isoform X4 n=1 Tax=Archocentrus centrarchus TaxID=63155 RepID=UPI0011E9D1A2|nr:acid phosphatase type 7 isoform X4 [Archocentrus centrarchus]
MGYYTDSVFVCFIIWVDWRLTDLDFLNSDQNTVCEFVYPSQPALCELPPSVNMLPVHAACALLFVAPLLVLGVPPIWTQPEQVHLSYGGVPGSMVVTWTTFNKTESKVEYSLLGAQLFELSARGDATLFVDSGKEKRKMFIHRVTLTGLKPAASYVYHCGSDEGWSDVFFFTALNDSTSFSPRFAFYGDLGNENPQSLARLQKDTQLGMYDVILHIGDFAYDMHEDNARIGDEFMRQIQSIAAYVPYMTCPGNHEATYNFSNYRNRFSMPGQTESLWYSWNLGSAHIISISTEVYFYLKFGLDLLFKQYEWLEKDLEVRLGRNDTKPPAPGLEDLFYRYGVDVELWAHEHTYERLWPVYGDKVYNGSKEQPYVNPKAPVHIITGSAGCRERTDKFNPNPKEWSAFRSTDYGYSRMQVVNGTHLYLEQVSDDQYGKVIDSIWVVKEKHGFSAWV